VQGKEATAQDGKKEGNGRVRTSGIIVKEKGIRPRGRMGTMEKGKTR